MPNPLDTLEPVRLYCFLDAPVHFPPARGVPIMPGVYARGVRVGLRDGKPAAILSIRGFPEGVYAPPSFLATLSRSSDGQWLHHPALGLAVIPKYLIMPAYPQHWHGVGLDLVPVSTEADAAVRAREAARVAEQARMVALREALKQRQAEVRARTQAAEAGVRDTLEAAGVPRDTPLREVPPAVVLNLWGRHWRRRRSAEGAARAVLQAIEAAVNCVARGETLAGAHYPHSVEEKAWFIVTGERPGRGGGK